MKREIIVDVMSRKDGYYTRYKGDLRIGKNLEGTKWFILKDLTDEEMRVLNTDKEFLISEYSVEDYYLILN